MKKDFLLLLIMSLVAMSACDKTFISNSPGTLPENYATIKDTCSKDSGKPIEITTRVGHSITECNGCIYINGTLGHADCQGWGDACVVKIRLWPIGGQPKGETFSMVVDTLWEPTSGDFFNMPARSLTVLDNLDVTARFLNIPAQILERDSLTRHFTFTRMFFSDTAAYIND
ncbi:MAG: hypothetical protein IKZ54_09105 [Bacteroidales bacterium]|nr:hypothetical protein [Bacteroidales bacterium]